MLAGESWSSIWNWGALAVAVVVAAGAIRSIARAFSAPDLLDERFTDRQRRARAGLEADHIIPALAHLVSAAASQVPGWSGSQLSEDDLSNLMQDELNSADYLDDLRKLGRLAGNYDRISTSYSGAEQSARVRGIAGIVSLAGLAYPAFWLVTSQDATNVWLWLSGVGTALAVVTMLGAWVNETRLRTRLVRLCRDYEHAS
jgi:hypothetical protein